MNLMNFSAELVIYYMWTNRYIFTLKPNASQSLSAIMPNSTNISSPFLETLKWHICQSPSPLEIKIQKIEQIFDSSSYLYDSSFCAEMVKLIKQIKT